MWHRVLEANRKQFPLKSYSLKKNSVNQSLKNKKNVMQNHNINILIRITDRKILCVYTHVCHIKKIVDLVSIILYVTLTTENIFLVSLLCEIKGKHTCFIWWGKWGKFGDALAEKKVILSWLINLNMVKPEKFDHLHFAYHFTVPFMLLSTLAIFSSWNASLC